MAGKNRKKMAEQKRQRKEEAMKTPGFQSRYARKTSYCVQNGVNASDIPEPKPWK